MKSEAEGRKSAGGADKKQQIQILCIKSQILNLQNFKLFYPTVIEMIIKDETVFVFCFVFSPH